MWPAILATGVYGGYFGAAQGVLLIAIMGIGLDETLQRLNAAKNVLAAVANGVAGVVFIVVADVDWLVVLLIGVGSVVGAQIGPGRAPALAVALRSRSWWSGRSRWSSSWSAEAGRVPAGGSGGAVSVRRTRSPARPPGPHRPRPRPGSRRSRSAPAWLDAR